MALTETMSDYLSHLGFKQDESYDVPAKPVEASNASLQAFLEQAGNESDRSICSIHLTGSGVKQNSIPLESLSKFVAAFQAGIEAIGGALTGHISISGSLPSDIVARTQMNMVGSPLPGSIILRVEPSISRLDDLKPNGDTLFELDEMGIEPLADQAFEQFSSLLNELACEGPDKEEFVHHLTDLGPRVANRIKEFCEAVDKSNVDAEFTWRDPGKDVETAAISYTFAKHAISVIDAANIETQTDVFEGTLVTLTSSNKDRIRLRTDEGEERTVSLGTIPETDVYNLNIGDRIRIEIERSINQRPGGRRSEKLIGRSIEKVNPII